MKVVNFNKLKRDPDAMACGGSRSSGAGSVGLTQRGADVAELLEKQVTHIINYTIVTIQLHFDSNFRPT